MTLPRMPLLRLFGILTIVSTLSLVFVANFHDLVNEKTNSHPRETGTDAADITAPLSSQEEALVRVYVQSHGSKSKTQTGERERNGQRGPKKSLEQQMAEVMKAFQSFNPSPTASPQKPLSKVMAAAETPKSSPNLQVRDEWINKSADCLPLPNRVIVVPVRQEECKEPHVVMHAGGQLGNKMCQYISLYLLRHIFGVRVSIPAHMREVLSRYFVNVTIPSQDPACFTKNTDRITYDGLYRKLQRKAAAESTPKMSVGSLTIIKSALMDTSYYVYHHPCPRDVIMAHRDLVRRVFTFKDEVLQGAKANLQAALRRIGWSHPRENTTLVTVHVRRRDYTAYIAKHYNLTQLDEGYFFRAFRHFRERVVNPVFVVVSDDHRWCQNKLEGGDVVLAGDKKDPESDLALLTLGDHTVISYGTFSFMGATLAKGDIAHPVNANRKYNHYKCAEDPRIKPINRDSDKYVT